MKGQIKYILALVFIFSTALGVSAADLDDLYQKKDQLQEKLEQAESAVKNKDSEVKSLSSQISSLENDIKATESKIVTTDSEISATTGSIEELESDIKAKNEELSQLKKKINSAIVEIYRFSAKSEWEIIFSSDSLGESSNQTKYVELIQLQVKASYDKLMDLKEDLDRKKQEQEKKKAELAELKARQEAYMQGAQYQVAQKDKLLSMTEQQKTEYESLAKKLQSEIAHISNEIYLERQRRASREWNLGGGGSGYSFSCGQVDPWRFYTCQCTSYAAWYWNVVLGKSWTNTRPGTGSAYNWANLARDQGYTVSSTPRSGAIVSWGKGLYPGDNWGHVAIVESVNSDGTVNLSEYNYVYREGFSRRMNVNPADEGVSFSYIY